MRTKILFADDDLLMHRLYRPHIERAGYEVIDAMDGEQAIALACRELPRVVIMDIIMPGTDGVSAIMQIKNSEDTKGIPVIAISGYPDYHQLQRQLAGAGVESFLPKEFSPAKLVSEIRRLDSTQSMVQTATA